MKFQSVIVLLFFISGLAYGQHRMDNWVFGDSLIVKFSESGPVLLEEKSTMRAFEAAACISDASGNLLFYSNNIGVWNRNHLPLLGSVGINSSLSPIGSTITNGCIFLPVSGDTSDRWFWIFITDEFDHKVRYSLIDRSLDGGLGGIVAGLKNMLVWDTPVCEQLNAVKHGNGKDWWLISRGDYLNSYVFNIALFNEMGLQNSYRLDTLISIGDNGMGELKFNLIGNRLGHVFFNPLPDGIDPFLAVYHFDRCSGMLTLIDSVTSGLSGNLYSFEFSPNGYDMLVSNVFGGKIYQVINASPDLSSTAIHADNYNAIGQFELWNDNYVYFVVRYLGGGLSGIPNSSQYLWRIGYDSTRMEQYYLDSFKIDLKKWNYTYSLHNFANYDLGPLVGSPCDTLSPPDTTQTAIPVFLEDQLAFSVFPTISDGVFQVQSSISGSLHVVDLYGREWLTVQIKERESFELKGAPAGMYLMGLYDEAGRFLGSRKIAIRR